VNEGQEEKDDDGEPMLIIFAFTAPRGACCTWTIPVLSSGITSMIVIVKGNEIAGVRPLVVHAVRGNALTRYIQANPKPGKMWHAVHATVKHVDWRGRTCSLNSTPKANDSTVSEVKDTVEVGTWGGMVSGSARHFTGSHQRYRSNCRDSDAV